MGYDMRLGSSLDRFATAVLVVCLGVVVSGTKACQTDYDFGTQAKVPNSTVTATTTSAGDGTAVTTGTVSSTPTSTSIGDTSGTAVPGATATATATAEAVNVEQDLFNELSKIGAATEAASKGVGVAGTTGGVFKPENWLGDAFSKDDNDSWIDSDGDGFSDTLEEQHGTDLNSASSAPRSVLVTRLAARIGVEVLPDESFPESDAVSDADLDGVSDQIEEKRGMNPGSADSDNDGLTDAKELSLGTNPMQIDSDEDGISDGLEYEFGADPKVPEPSRRTELSIIRSK